jgi:excisionase family DNA binding protein
MQPTKTIERRRTNEQALADRSLLTAREVAALLNLSVRTVWALRSAGKLRGRKIGPKATRFKREDVERLIEKG